SREACHGSVELREVLRRIVALTRQEFGADRAWLLHPVNETVEFARPRFSDTAPDCKVGEEDAGPIPLARSRPLIRRAMESPLPFVLTEGDAAFDRPRGTRFGARS